jgi:hypothetical protein
VLVHANRDDSDLLEVSTGMSRDDVFNAVVASSDQEVPVTAVAYQYSGPLRYRPGFQKPRFFSTPVVTSYDGMGKTAASILQRSLAFSRSIAGDVLPDPSLDAGSLVQWTNPDEETTMRILSQFVLPLGPGAMSVQTRVDADVALASDTGSLD